MASIESQDGNFEEVKFAITTLLRAMMAQGAPMGSVGLLQPEGQDVCVIVATGNSAPLWEELHRAWEAGELTEEATDGE